MKIIESLWHRFASVAHALGALYYFWWAANGLVGIVGGYLLMESVTSRLDKFLYAVLVLAAVVMLMLIPLLAYRIVGNKKRTTANPNLIIQLRTVHYKIASLSLVKKQKLTFKAKKEIDIFKFRVAVSGGLSAQVTLGQEGHSLLGPMRQQSADVYHVKFVKPLEKDQVLMVELNIHVDDPEQKMRSYLTDDFSVVDHVEIFEAEYEFDKKPNQVLQQVVSSLTDEGLGTMQQLIPQNAQGCHYRFTLNNPEYGTANMVSWS
jgi:hypothetical protein